MASVYKNAQCNIAATFAADGDGVCFQKRDPCIVMPTEIVSNPESRDSSTYQIAHSGMYDDDMVQTALNMRAWVVQERCLAQRQLCFSKDQVYWECAELVACEQFPSGLPEQLWDFDVRRTRPPTAKPTLTAGTSSELRQVWCSLVDTYSGSGLTKPSDKMVAIAGLADLYCNITKDTYLAGLWKNNLIAQLCWTYQLGLDDQRGRSRMEQYCAPTWSWPSLDCPVNFDTDYYERPVDHADLAEVLKVSCESRSPSGLHSFESGLLRLRGMAVWAAVGSSAWARIERIHLDPTSPFSELEPAHWTAYWDEDPHSFMESQSLEQMSTFSEDKSDLLILFISGSSSGRRANFKALILRKSTSGPSGTYTRAGVWWCYDLEGKSMTSTPFWLIAGRLGLEPHVSLEDKIDFDDPRLADLIQVVSII